MTPTFIYPFAISAIPAVSAAISVGDKNKAYKNIESAFRNCSLIAIPCAIGMGTMSGRILDILFSKRETIETGVGSVTTHGIASPALSVVSAAIFFLGIISITNSVLQTWRKERLTIVSTFSGVAVKFIVTWIVSGISGSGIMGSSIGTASCYFTIMALNLFFVIKYTGYVPHIGRIFAKPFVAGIACGLCAYGTAYVLDMTNINRHLVTIAAIGIAVVVYAAVVLLTKGIYREDVMMMPKGAKIASLMDKFGLLDKKEI
jgi:stage V sporulation protein B